MLKKVVNVKYMEPGSEVIKLSLKAFLNTDLSLVSLKITFTISQTEVSSRRLVLKFMFQYIRSSKYIWFQSTRIIEHSFVEGIGSDMHGLFYLYSERNIVGFFSILLIKWSLTIEIQDIFCTCRFSYGVIMLFYFQLYSCSYFFFSENICSNCSSYLSEVGLFELIFLLYIISLIVFSSTFYFCLVFFFP